MSDEFKFVDEDFSDLEIPKEMVSKKELLENPEVQRYGKKINKSKILLAILALVILIVGAAFLFQVSYERGQMIDQQTEASQGAY